MELDHDPIDYLTVTRIKHEEVLKRSLEPFRFEHIVAKAKLSSKTASKQVTYLSHLADNGHVREASDLNRN